MAHQTKSVASRIFGSENSGKKMICLVVLVFLGLSGLGVLVRYDLQSAIEFWKVAITPAVMGILGYVNGSRT